MEQALVYEISKITELNNKIYPTNIPEGETPPCLVYIMSYYDQLRALNEILDNTDKSYMLNILCSSYSQMKELTDKVKETLLAFISTNIGENQILVENVVINNISETYENELKLYRGILDIKISY